MLPKECPLVSRALIAPWRLVTLVFGLGLLMAGSIFLPSTDWDFPICFVMGLPAYVLAPWAFRQVWYRRGWWMAGALLAFWFSVDGTYTLYWWLRHADFLSEFRLANVAYCTPIFMLAGFVWNLDLARVEGLGGLVGERP